MLVGLGVAALCGIKAVLLFDLGRRMLLSLGVTMWQLIVPWEYSGWHSQWLFPHICLTGSYLSQAWTLILRKFFMEYWCSLNLGICSTLSFSRWWQILFIINPYMHADYIRIYSHSYCWEFAFFFPLYIGGKSEQVGWKHASFCSSFDMVTCCHL